MKIAFDGQLFLKGKKAGIAWSAHNLILELAKYEENECTIQYFSHRSAPEQLENLKIYQENKCNLECCKWFSYVLYRIIWLFVPVPYRFFFRTKPDITQFFNFTIPPGVSGQRIVILHDMAYKSCPYTVKLKTRLWLELSIKKTCSRADHIITVSEFSKQEIARYLKIPREKITVVPNAVDHHVYHTNYTGKQIQMVKDKYGIEKDYFLYIGTIEPRKNLERLILAYAKLQKEKKYVPQLVLAGAKGWRCKNIYEKVQRLNLRNRILFPGYVDQEDSPLLMCGAVAFVFPSLYEGFGMPPLEAMACGTPVIASAVTALPEVVKDAGILVDPRSVKEICTAMKELLENEAYRKELGVLGMRRAQKYTWQKSAEMLMEIYRRKIYECV